MSRQGMKNPFDKKTQSDFISDTKFLLWDQSDVSYQHLLANICSLIFVRWVYAYYKIDNFEHESSNDAYENFVRLLENPAIYWDTFPFDDFQKNVIGIQAKESSDRKHEQTVQYLTKAYTTINITTSFKKWVHTWIDSLDFTLNSHSEKALWIIGNFIQLASNTKKPFVFHTPKPIIDLMVDLADPKPGEIIYDPCFGSGGMLLESISRIKNSFRKKTNDSKLNLSRVDYVFGQDISFQAYVIAVTKFILSGLSHPHLEIGDSLNKRSGVSEEAKYDIILSNPPVGYVKKKISNELMNSKDFFIRSKDLSNLFVQHIINNLKTDGRAVVIVPDSILFKSGPDKKLRQLLLEQLRVEEIISLPEGAIGTSAKIKSSIIYFRKSQPNKNVYLYDILKSNDARAHRISKKGNSFRCDRISEIFRSDKLKENRNVLTVTQLAARNWEMIAKDSGDVLIELMVSMLQDDSSDLKINIQPLNQVASILKGIAYNKDSIYVGDENNKEKIGLLRISDVSKDKLIPSLSLSIDKISLKSNIPILRRNDLLLSTSGHIGRLAIFSEEKSSSEQLSFSRSLTLIRPNREILSEYIFSLFHSTFYQRWLLGHARGATIQELSIKALRNLPIPVPSIDIQQYVIGQYKNGEDAVFALTSAANGKIANKALLDLHQKIEIVLKHIPYSDQPADELSMDDILNRLNLVGHLISEMEDKLEDYTETGWLDTWWPKIKRAMTSFIGIQNIPFGPTLYLVLKEIYNYKFDKLQPSEVEDSIPNRIPYEDDYSVSVLLDEEKMLIDSLNDLVGSATNLIWEVLERLRKVSINISNDPSSIPIGKDNIIQVRLINLSSLPILRLNVKTDPDIGKVTIPFLQEKSDTLFSLHIPTQQSAGKYEFDLICEGNTIAGDDFNLILRSAVGVSESPYVIDNQDFNPSPYIAGSPIEDKEKFFGRRDIIRKIERQLTTSHKSNIILLEGNRRSGKTSILYQLKSNEDIHGWVPVYCSFQGARGHDQRIGLPTEEIFKLLLKDIFKEVTKHGYNAWLPNTERPNLTDREIIPAFVRACNDEIKTIDPLDLFIMFLENVLATIAPNRILLLLDEFEKIQEGIDSKVTSPQVPNNLRYILQTYRDITAILSYSKTFRRSRESYWSILFGLGFPISLKALDYVDARLLVTQPAKDDLIYIDKARDQIINLCACQPYLIQRLCNRIFEIAAESGERLVSEHTVINAAQIEAMDNEHFATIWRDSIDSERQRYIMTIFEKYSSDCELEMITLNLLETKLEEAGIRYKGKYHLGNDLSYLRDLDVIEIVNRGESYKLSIPLIGFWIKNNIDVEDQKRRAQIESEEIIA